MQLGAPSCAPVRWTWEPAAGHLPVDLAQLWWGAHLRQHQGPGPSLCLGVSSGIAQGTLSYQGSDPGLLPTKPVLARPIKLLRHLGTTFGSE